MAVSAMDDANVRQLFFTENTFPVTEIPQVVDIHILHPANLPSADITGFLVANPCYVAEVAPVFRVQVDLAIPDPREEYPKFSCHSR